MVKGWFVGAFSPVAFSTNNFEVAVKKYQKGDHETKHLHKIATEITVIIQGIVQMNGKVWQDGDIIVIAPNESTDFKAITDVITVVVKTPSVLNDKY
jgi:anti-sigma factor ChrR (cupin superfamily)